MEIIIYCAEPCKVVVSISFDFLQFLTVFMNVGLLTVSLRGYWHPAALQPGLTRLSLAIVGVRFFGVSRACRYFERVYISSYGVQGLYGFAMYGFMLI